MPDINILPGMRVEMRLVSLQKAGCFWVFDIIQHRRSAFLQTAPNIEAKSA
jgi:hypothetical protein